MPRRRRDREGQHRPRSYGGEVAARGDWVHPDIENAYSSYTQSRPASRNQSRPPSRDRSPYFQGHGAEYTRRDPYYYGRGGQVNPLHNEGDPYSRDGMLGLYSNDRGFVPGCRPPRPRSHSGPDRLNTFNRLGFGQEPDPMSFADRDDREQASHPIVHRHSPLGRPRVLGSGPDYFEWHRSADHTPRSSQSRSPRGNFREGVDHRVQDGPNPYNYWRSRVPTSQGYPPACPYPSSSPTIGYPGSPNPYRAGDPNLYPPTTHGF